MLLYDQNVFCLIFSGAIAGIADQPLQSIQESSGNTTPTTVKARSIITGVGKGLVGVVIKPLGGAAEFVAQTGQGKYQLSINAYK